MLLKRLLSAILSLSLVFMPEMSYAAPAMEALGLPLPGAMLSASPAFTPVVLKGMIIHPDEPLKFDFVMDTGTDHASGEALRTEAENSVKYFLSSLTVPEDEMWVNLSPYEKDRIIPDNFGKTMMGRDVLAQDYILKQLAASLLYPEKELGKQFWSKVYAESAGKSGAESLDMNDFNRVWIAPAEAQVWEHDGKVVILKSRLKVMLETDYVATPNNQTPTGGHFAPQPNNEGGKVSPSQLPSGLSMNAEATKVSTESPNASVATLVPGSQELTRNIMREVILPVLEKEVNEGKNFARLRQVYAAMILATWYKTRLKESLLGTVYADKNKVAGIGFSDSVGKDEIYNNYLKTVKEGVFNYIKDETDTITGESVPRKYFSGGVTWKGLAKLLVGAVLIASSFAGLPKDAQAQGQSLAGDTVRVESTVTKITSQEIAAEVNRNLDALRGHDDLFAEYDDMATKGSVAEVITGMYEAKKKNVFGADFIQESIKNIKVLWSKDRKTVEDILIAHLNDPDRLVIFISMTVLQSKKVTRAADAFLKATSNNPFVSGCYLESAIALGAPEEVALPIAMKRLAAPLVLPLEKRVIYAALGKYSVDAVLAGYVRMLEDPANDNLEVSSFGMSIFASRFPNPLLKLLDHPNKKVRLATWFALDLGHFPGFEQLMTGSFKYWGREFTDASLDSLVAALEKRGVNLEYNKKLPDNSWVTRMNVLALKNRQLHTKFSDVLTPEDQGFIARINDASLEDVIEFNRSLIERGHPHSPRNVVYREGTQIKRTEDVPAIVELIEDQDYRKRVLALIALREGGYPQAMSTAARLEEDDPHPYVRFIARNITIIWINSLGELKAEADLSNGIVMAIIGKEDLLANSSSSPDSLTTDSAQGVGGIDLNAQGLDLQIKRDGKGLVLPVAQQNWSQVNVQGFAPVIDRIERVNMSILLGTVSVK